MNKENAIVVTSINSPELPAFQSIAQGVQEHPFHFIVIGDKKSPATFELDGCSFFSLQDQIQTGFHFAQACPIGHYARKNIGYLIAIKKGVKTIVETDDDNIPLGDFWNTRTAWISSSCLDFHDWVNVYQYFSNELIWPRGLPLDSVKNNILPDYETLKTELRYCPIQQGLADANPDVDAIYRLILTLPIAFKPDRQVILSNGSWCPFNSQNTTWFPDAYPLLYLPSYCSFRMTDIWRSFVAQRIAWLNDWSILFHSPTVFQERNEHNLMRDFEDEISGYIHNRRIGNALMELSLQKGKEFIPDNLRKCYAKMVDLELIDKKELSLLELWLKDLAEISLDLG